MPELRDLTGKLMSASSEAEKESFVSTILFNFILFLGFWGFGVLGFCGWSCS
jgi:hypothetical protein